MLRTEQSTTDVDLALALENEEGTFLARKAGQSFLVVAEKGHSIEVSGEGAVSRDRSRRGHGGLVRD